MLWTLFIVLLTWWLLGVVSGFTLGGFIHILLVLAVLSLSFQLIAGPARAPVVTEKQRAPLKQDPDRIQ